MVEKTHHDNREGETVQSARTSAQAPLLGTLGGTQRVASRKVNLKGSRSRAAGKPTPRASSEAKGQNSKGGKPSACGLGKPGTAEEEESTRSKSLPQIKDSWNHYRSYHAMVYSLTPKQAGVEKERVMKTLQERKASCFWIAAALTMGEGDWERFIRKVQEVDAKEGLDKPVSLLQAIEIYRIIGSKAPIYWHNLIQGTVDQLGGQTGFSPGPMHVVLADDESFSPHWLPISRKKESAPLYRPPKKLWFEQMRSVVGDPDTEELAEEKEPVSERPGKERVSEQAVSSNIFDVLRDECDSKETEDKLTSDSEESEEMLTESVVETTEAKTAEPPPPRRGGGVTWTFKGPKMPLREKKLVDPNDIPFFDAAYGHLPPPTIKTDCCGTVTRWFEGNTDESSPYAIAAPHNWRSLMFRFNIKRKIVEARKEVLLARTLSRGDWVYQRVCGDHATNRYLTASGGLKLEWIETVECEKVHLNIGTTRVVTFPDGREYLIAPLVQLHSFGSLVDHLNTLGKKKYKVKRIGLRHCPETELSVDNLSSLPTEVAKVRATYALMKPLTAEHLVGPVNDIRNEHLALKEEELGTADPISVLRDVTEMDKKVRQQLMRVPAFGYKARRGQKACVSCGRDPPASKYRWKHRICSHCNDALTKRGYVSWSGSQVQDNLHVPTCYPGLVYVKAEQHAPPAKKWKLVQTKVPIEESGGKEKCLVHIDYRAAAVGPSRDKPPKRWVEMEARDLEKLKNIPCKERFSHALAGIGCSGARPKVCATSSYTCAKALLARLFGKLPIRAWGEGPVPGIWQWVTRFVPLLLPDFRASEMPFDEWLDSMRSSRKAALRRGKERLDRTGWLKNFECFTSFVKTELSPGFAKWKGDLVRLEEDLERPINGPSEESHCIAGPKVKPYINLLKERWNCDFPIFYGSTKPEYLHKWLQELVKENRQFFWCDFSRYDRTHSDATWDFVESFYPKDDPMFLKVLQAWRRPRGRIGPMKFQAPTVNASGRDDTALANALLNGFATYLSACSAWLKIRLHDLTPEDVQQCMTVIKLSVCGDDSLGYLPSCSEERMQQFREMFNQNIEQFGFIAKLCTSSDVGQAVYLGMRPYPTSKGWFWGKTIGRATYKLGWVMLENGRDVMAHITGIAEMHRLCSRHVPVLSDIAEQILALRSGAKRTPVYLDPEKPWEWTYASGVEYDEATLEMVAQVYSRRDTPGNPCDWERDVTVQDVKDLIKEIKAVERLPCVIDHWLWKHMVYADDL